MSKLMMIAGILLMALAIVLGLMTAFSSAATVGFSLDTAVTLLVGGLLCLGLGGVISALESGAMAVAPLTARVAAAAAEVETAAETVIPEFGRKAAAPAVAAAAAATAKVEEISPAVNDTIKALEQARTDILQAFGEGERAAPAAAPDTTESDAAEELEARAPLQAPVAEAVAEAEEEVAEQGFSEEETPVEEEGQLYVLEERQIRNRPARILSDGTVEAETDEGWMRFENLEHLDEYLDAMLPTERG